MQSRTQLLAPEMVMSRYHHIPGPCFSLLGSLIPKRNQTFVSFLFQMLFSYSTLVFILDITQQETFHSRSKFQDPSNSNLPSLRSTLNHAHSWYKKTALEIFNQFKTIIIHFYFSFPRLINYNYFFLCKTINNKKSLKSKPYIAVLINF